MTMNTPSTPFAVFLVAFGYPHIAATTRTTGGYGLPGGKVDPNEHPIAALRRECAEEGWMVGRICGNPIRKAIVDGKEVWWYTTKDAVTRLQNYKEQGRILPVWVTPDMLTRGLGNEFVQDLLPKQDTAQFWERYWDEEYHLMQYA